jgi:hypothetical protein
VLGLEWLKQFDAHTKAHQVGAYRLLILGGHESHLNQKSKEYCLEHKILTFSITPRIPPHSSHILQPLNVVCFLPLKRKYSQRVRDLACKRVFHINKERFLPAFKDAFFDIFTGRTVARPLRHQALFLPTRKLCLIDLKYSCTPCHNPYRYQKTHYGSPKHKRICTNLDPSQS